MTIFDYLLSTRIQNSIPLLMDGENITTIAGLVGFSSPAYYGQIFKRYMGMSPSQYKRMPPSHLPVTKRHLLYIFALSVKIFFHKSDHNS